MLATRPVFSYLVAYRERTSSPQGKGRWDPYAPVCRKLSKLRREGNDWLGLVTQLGTCGAGWALGHESTETCGRGPMRRMPDVAAH